MWGCSTGDEQLDFYQPALNLPKGHTGEHGAEGAEFVLIAALSSTSFLRLVVPHRLQTSILPTLCFLGCLFILMWSSRHIFETDTPGRGGLVILSRLLCSQLTGRPCTWKLQEQGCCEHSMHRCSAHTQSCRQQCAESLETFAR